MSTRWQAELLQVRTCALTAGEAVYCTHRHVQKAHYVVEFNKESIRDRSCSICEETLMTVECKL